MFKTINLWDFSKSSNYIHFAKLSKKMLASDNENDRIVGKKIRKILEREGYVFGNDRPTVM
ncbi:hypothetical protein BTT_65700 (plasmid) [Bacillus thuringiensis serovar morrisoni str. 4AA1]|uniref:hypothetical protein n=1 Tax=Bacillus TaxID=1386 RepID=UPI000A3C95EB|nr:MULTISPECIES: hypothetical protein [Bacillus]MED3102301.1 hypothetical protein [Bacillus thuringiensis]MRA99933.1 hypothetical protein [Bacillus thuringiensis]OTY45413.1 hypothetical protein BK736_02650 [Bacillus thuringiensis serovar poloniensis]RNG45571.1 hypothetical protein EEL55_16035 [Bacillus thuringiensis]RUR59054.1 hypothetical protein ELS81_30540 [Bacillus sp. VKPM B-3276]